MFDQNITHNIEDLLELIDGNVDALKHSSNQYLKLYEENGSMKDSKFFLGSFLFHRQELRNIYELLNNTDTNQIFIHEKTNFIEDNTSPTAAIIISNNGLFITYNDIYECSYVRKVYSRERIGERFTKLFTTENWVLEAVDDYGRAMSCANIENDIKHIVRTIHYQGKMGLTRLELCETYHNFYSRNIVDFEYFSKNNAKDKKSYMPTTYRFDTVTNMYYCCDTYSTSVEEVYPKELRRIFSCKNCLIAGNDSGIVIRIRNTCYYFNIVTIKKVKERCFVMKDLTNDGIVKVFYFPGMFEQSNYILNNDDVCIYEDLVYLPTREENWAIYTVDIEEVYRIKMIGRKQKRKIDLIISIVPEKVFEYPNWSKIDSIPTPIGNGYVVAAITNKEENYKFINIIVWKGVYEYSKARCYKVLRTFIKYFGWFTEGIERIHFFVKNRILEMIVSNTGKGVHCYYIPLVDLLVPVFT